MTDWRKIFSFFGILPIKRGRENRKPLKSSDFSGRWVTRKGGIPLGRTYVVDKEDRETMIYSSDNSCTSSL